MSRYPRSARATEQARRLIRSASAEASTAVDHLSSVAAIVAALPSRSNPAMACDVAARLLLQAAGNVQDLVNCLHGVDRLMETIAAGHLEPEPPRPPAAPALPVPTQQEWWAQEMRDCTAYQQAAEIRRAA